ncbi:MAG: MFS transporter [Planctomycetaceae bacterium]|nr:MFS transporter [Planctomycetaceae bacterium]
MHLSTTTGTHTGVPPTPVTVAAAAGPPLNRLIAVAAMLVIYSLAYFQRTGIPGTIFDQLQHDFSLSATSVTALGSVFVYVYAGMQLIVGIAADSYGGRRTMLLGSTIMCVGAVLFPSAHTTSMLFVSRVLIGFGSSFIYLSIVKEIDTLFSARHFAGLLGLVLLASYAGNIAATLPFERAVHRFGWRATLMAVAGLSCLSVAVAWAVLRQLPRMPTSHGRLPWRALAVVLRNGRSHGLLICGMINFPITFVIQGVLGKKFLEDVAGLTSAGAATFLLIMASVCGVAVGCSGLTLRLTGQRRKPVILFAVSMILLSTLLLLVAVLTGAPGWVFLISYVLLALSLAGSPPSLATMKEVNRPDTVAVTIAVLNTVTYLGVGIVGNLSGLVLDLFASRAAVAGERIVYPPAAYTTLFACLAALAFLSTLVTVFRNPETRGQSLPAA